MCHNYCVITVFLQQPVFLGENHPLQSFAACHMGSSCQHLLQVTRTGSSAPALSVNRLLRRSVPTSDSHRRFSFAPRNARQALQTGKKQQPAFLDSDSAKVSVAAPSPARLVSMSKIFLLSFPLLLHKGIQSGELVST